MNSITHIMNKDHKKIKELLILFEDEANKNSEKTMEIFQRFKWNLEKHFFVEEKVIFNSYELESEEENEDISRILNEHIQILNLMEKIGDLFPNLEISDISEMKRILLSHAKFEDEVFYPKLDETIDGTQRLEIVQKLGEVILE